jgi:hypothetical protein
MICGWRNRMDFSKFVAPQQLRVDFGKFGELALQFPVRGDALAGFSALVGRFEQKLPHPAGAQALRQIIKGAVLESPPAAAVPFAARQVVPDIGRPDQIRRRVKLRQQSSLALEQGRGGFYSCANCLNHIYSQRQPAPRRKSKNAASLPAAHGLGQHFMDRIFAQLLFVR